MQELIRAVEKASSGDTRADQLYYRIMDHMVDTYLPVMDHYGEAIDTLEANLRKYGVLVFRNVEWSADEQLRFATSFGKISKLGAFFSKAFRSHTTPAWLRSQPATMQNAVTPINSVRRLN